MSTGESTDRGRRLATKPCPEPTSTRVPPRSRSSGYRKCIKSHCGASIDLFLAISALWDTPSLWDCALLSSSTSASLWGGCTSLWARFWGRLWFQSPFASRSRRRIGWDVLSARWQGLPLVSLVRVIIKPNVQPYNGVINVTTTGGDYEVCCVTLCRYQVADRFILDAYRKPALYRNRRNRFLDLDISAPRRL
jgi:hypothetical protein